MNEFGKTDGFYPSTFWNEVRLWWHCLIHIHRQCAVWYLKGEKFIWCDTCYPERWKDITQGIYSKAMKVDEERGQ
jgi:hypothetical protein